MLGARVSHETPPSRRSSPAAVKTNYSNCVKLPGSGDRYVGCEARTPKPAAGQIKVDDT